MRLNVVVYGAWFFVKYVSCVWGMVVGQENCPAFYVEIGDLAAAMECYSVVDTMDSFSWRTGKVRQCLLKCARALFIA